jgi:asparagine synthase (glutamine-hydrolysing)
MRSRLPPAILTRAKVGFDIPAHDWLRRELKPLLLEVTRGEALARSGLFRRQAVQALVAEHLDRRRNLGFHLWGLMVLLLWMERWQIRSPLEIREIPEPSPLLSVSRTN